MVRKQRGNGEPFVFLLIAVVVLAICAVERASCTSKWELSGLKTQWGPLKGCLVQVPNGRWLPEDVVREVDLKEISK